MMMVVRLMQVVWMIARYEECAGRMDDMMKVEVKKGWTCGLCHRIQQLSCGKCAKRYEGIGTSKRLAPYKSHAKSLAIHEDCEFLSHSHQYPTI